MDDKFKGDFLEFPTEAFVTKIPDKLFPNDRKDTVYLFKELVNGNPITQILNETDKLTDGELSISFYQFAKVVQRMMKDGGHSPDNIDQAIKYIDFLMGWLGVIEAHRVKTGRSSLMNCNLQSRIKKESGVHDFINNDPSGREIGMENIRKFTRRVDEYMARKVMGVE